MKPIQQSGLIRRLFPFLNWPRVSAEILLGDLIAGVAVALLAIPQALAYAQLAGIPAYYGLYAAFIPVIVAALYGSSPILSSGPVAMTSLLTAASISHITPVGSPDFVPYVTLLALLSGLIQIGLGLVRAGVLLNLLSHPVLMGFINAAAMIIALSQLSTMTGIVVPQTDHFVIDVVHVISNIGNLHGMTAAFVLLSIILLYGLKRLFPKLPGVLITVVTLTMLSYFTKFAEHGGKVIGEIPAGLPSISVPAMSWNALILLLPAAFVIAIISFMEAMSSCKVIAIKTRARWDENQELIGQGLAKVAAAFCHSMPVSGSFSRSALNLASGARSAYSTLIATGIVLLTLLFFTSLMYHLPKPTLSAMIVLAVLNLIDLSVFRLAWQAQRDDGVAAVVTFVATLAFAPNIQIGILIGILFSLGAYIYRQMAPRSVDVGMHEDGVLRDRQRFNLPPLHDKIAALRFDSSLIFTNAAYFEDEVLRLEAAMPNLTHILIVANGINHVDATGIEMLRRLVMRLHEVGITLAVSGAKRQIMEVMERTGLARHIGADNIFAFDSQAVRNLLTRVEAPDSH